MRDILTSIEGEFRRYRRLGEAALAQIRDEELSQTILGNPNSAAVLVWHLSGNLKSRFTDFLTTDGEKPWRKRDEEFRSRQVTRAELMDNWNEGWRVLSRALESLTDQDLERTVLIRGEKFRAHEALLRLLAHASYHVGQIVHIGKSLRSQDWQCLSIPLGKSEEANQNPAGKQ